MHITSRSTGAPLRVTVNVQAQPVGEGKWAINVTTVTGDRSGERQLIADSCDEARRAVALLVSLMLDPDAHSVEPESSPAPLATATARRPQAPAPSQNEPKPTEVTPRPTPAAPGSSAVRSTPRGFLGAALVADEGTLPALGVGGRLNLGLSAGRWALALRAGAWASRSAQYPGVPGAGARFSLYDVGFAACGSAIQQGNTALQLCIGPALTLFYARSYGVSSPASAAQLAWGAFGELALRYSLVRGVSIRLGLECQVPFQKPNFVIEDLGQVFQQSSIAERISLGPELEF